MMSKRTTNAAVGRAREAVILHTTSLGAQTCRGFFTGLYKKKTKTLYFHLRFAMFFPEMIVECLLHASNVISISEKYLLMKFETGFEDHFQTSCGKVRIQYWNIDWLNLFSKSAAKTLKKLSE